ncbi:MAG: phospholipase D-like domain-containing protein [Defluviitaleaceae bacterium]|nr:phospholipase D-like domain-containing protein [Defluviitaleaceae bacterium]
MKRKHIKKSTSVIVLCIVAYVFLAIIPYLGGGFVTEETRAAFAIENFYGQQPGPERVMLLEHPRDSFYHRLNLISQAQEEIILTTFAIRSGISADIIIGALLHAADRGVNIRVLNNAIVGQMQPRYLHALSAHENISVYLFNRFQPHRPQYINASLHDKYMIVDDTFLILGGRNIGDRDFAVDDSRWNASLDREVLVYNTQPGFQGSLAQTRAYFYRKINSTRAFPRETSRPNAHARQQEFTAIYLQHRENHHIHGFDYYSGTTPAYKITLITNNPETARKESIVAYNLLQITKHSSQIVVQSPYIALTNRHKRIFSDAVQGRDFVLLTNSLASTPNMPSFSSYLMSRDSILASGITIYEFQSNQSSIHAKTFLFNGQLTAIGSFNINERSIRSDTESMLIIHSQEFHDITLAAINSLRAQSLRVGYEAYSHIPQAQASTGKRIIYTIAGYALRGLRFLF